MRRRGFMLNSLVLLLLIPLMLLIATYEDATSQIVQAQSERTQAERTYRTISYFEMDFQKALEISAKRALIATTEYVATTDFIRGEKANETIANLILRGYSSVGISNEQNLKMWLENITLSLRKQGYYVSPSVDEILNSISITVAPLDSFHIAVSARIPRIKITDSSGIVIYEGALPRNRNALIIISLEGIEDAFIARETNDFYHRIIKACNYPYPELVEKPVKVLNGTGESDIPIVTGVYGEDISYNATHIWKDGSYITNTTINGVEVSPTNVLEDNDVGVLVFDFQQADQSPWCSFLGYRVNVTINSAQSLEDYQIKLDLSNVPPFNSLSNIPEMEIFYSDCSGQLNYWVERWDSTGKILWIKVNLTGGTNVISIYFDSSVVGSAGDPERVFDFYDDFTSGLHPSKWMTNTNQYSVENGYIKMWGDWSGKYLNTVKSFNFPVIVEGVWRLGQTGTDEEKDTDLAVSFMSSITSTPHSSGSIDAIYDGTETYCDGWQFLGICIGERDYGKKRIGYKGNVAIYGNRITTTQWQQFRIVYTPNYIEFWDSRDGTLSHPNTMFMPFHLGISADTDSSSRYGYIDWIRVRKYVSPEPSVIFGGVEERSTTDQLTTGRAYDIQPFVECLENGYYFGIYNAPSFFERLEGSMDNHAAYESLAHQMQDELGVKYGDQYYPIGLVSFMIPTNTTGFVYDKKLNDLLITLEENVNSVDFCFLQHYFPIRVISSRCGDPVYRVYGISDSPDRSSIYFFIDNQTAVAIFGAQGAQDLLQR